MLPINKSDVTTSFTEFKVHFSLVGDFSPAGFGGCCTTDGRGGRVCIGLRGADVRIGLGGGSELKGSMDTLRGDMVVGRFTLLGVGRRMRGNLAPPTPAPAPAICGRGAPIPSDPTGGRARVGENGGPSAPLTSSSEEA